MNADFLIIGGGIMGLSLALEVKRRHADCSVLLIDKEPSLGAHASGRNSGVVHAGFYYTADSLKARFTRDGARELTDYCLDRGLPINRCGKLVVARGEGDLAGLEELQRRGATNGVPLQWLTEGEARRIEPRVRTAGWALWSPATASVDPKRVLGALAEDAAAARVTIRTGVMARNASWRAGSWVVTTSAGPLEAGYLVNVAGLHADRIAHRLGFGERYAVLPFKGLYLYAPEPPGALRTHVYPVPDLEQPFLGVHFTVTVDGRIKIGPTAIPALWLEHYAGFKNFRLGELASIVALQARLLAGNRFGFARLAAREVGRYRRRRLVREASAMVEGLAPAGEWRWGSPGVRAQLVDLAERRLEMDFRFEGDDRSFHLLNAVSPAFTCSLAFSRYLAERIEALVAGRRPGREASSA